MPRKCSIRGCKTNYDSETENYSTFSLPKDETLRSKWLKSIPNDLSELKHPVICIKHFDESCVSWTDVIYSKGERKEYPRKIPKLAEGAVPTIFPNAPEYLSTDVPSAKAPPTIIVALPSSLALASTSKKSADSEAESLSFVGCEVSLREGVSDCLEEKLIELARSKPALYDTNHPDYFKGKVKQDIWKEIAKKLELGSGKYFKLYISCLKQATLLTRKYLRANVNPMGKNP